MKVQAAVQTGAGRAMRLGAMELRVDTACCHIGAGELEIAVPQFASGPNQPLRDPPDSPMKDPPREPIHDPVGDPTREPQQPFGEPDPVPGRDPVPETPNA